MPIKVHSSKVQSNPTNKAHCSHPNLQSILSSHSSPQSQHPHAGSSTIHSTLVAQNNHHHSRSKGSLVVKKRPLGLSRNNTSVNLIKSTTTSHPRKSLNPPQRRPPKRGAFKGALDPDFNEDLDDTQDLLLPSSELAAPPKACQKEDEAWVSEPSTRSATPNPQQALHHQSASPPPDIPNPQLGLQLPNPLVSNSPPPLQSATIPPPLLQPPRQPSTPSPPVESSTPKQNCDASIPHFNPSSAPRGRSMNHDPVSAKSPQSFDECHPATPTAEVNPSMSPQSDKRQHPSSLQCPSPSKGKGKTSSTPPQKHSSTKHLSINSVRSLSSLALFHNDLLTAQNLTRQGLKRVDSTASVVLPPKIDRTEAVITLNGKGTFHPTLNAISDFPPELSEPRSNPPSYSTEPRSMKANSPDAPPILPDSKHSQPLPSGSKTLPAPEQSECTRRLQRYSNMNGQAHYINLKAANDFSTGLMSSLLSPQLTFKSRRAQTPGTQTHLGNGTGYFDSFKSLVGMSSLAAEPSKSDHSLGRQDLANQPSEGSSPQTYTQSSKSAASTDVMSSSLPKDSKIGIHQRYPLVQRGSIKLTNPKPVVPGFITTCGPTPVVSKFLGPRPILSSSHTETSHSFNMGADRSQGWNNERLDKTEEEANQSKTDSPLHTSSKMGHQSGSSTVPRRSATDLTSSLSRIQKKLLMERDRPISPTSFEQLNHQITDYGNPSNQVSGPKTSRSPPLIAGGQLGAGGSSAGTLPPPSYLIRSLGGQTGPLPFIPLNLLPSTQSTTAQINHSHPRSNTPVGNTKVTNTTSNEKKNQQYQKDTTNVVITPSTPTPTMMTPQPQQEPNWFNPTSDVNGGSRLNEPALKAKQALSIKLWRNSLIDEVEQILTDHESNTRFRNPLVESFQRISKFDESFYNS